MSRRNRARKPRFIVDTIFVKREPLYVTHAHHRDLSVGQNRVIVAAQAFDEALSGYEGKAGLDVVVLAVGLLCHFLAIYRETLVLVTDFIAGHADDTLDVVERRIIGIAKHHDLAALRLNPNDTQALHQLVTYFIATGDTVKAKCVGDRLVAIDPMSNEAKTRAYWYLNQVDPDGALQNAQYALASKDTEVAGHDVRAMALILRGSDGEAQQEAERVMQLLGSSYLGKSLKAMIAADRGDRAGAEAYMKMFEADANRYHWAALRMVLIHARLGDNAEAVKWLKRSYELGNHTWYQLVKHPWLASLQSDPEFQNIIVTMKKDIDDVNDDVTGVYQLICK